MSETIREYFNNAQFAQAAYAELNTSINNTDSYVTKLTENGGFSVSQATQFASQYSIIHDQQNTSTGFSATLFKDKSNQYTLAIRGTELSSILADIALTDFGDIGADGIALKQGIDLFNYHQKLITPAGTGNAMQLDLYEGSLPPSAGTPYQVGSFGFRYLKVIAPANGLGIIPPEAKINVAGHSLGGHLALIMARLDPAHINQVYTYNAPGFDVGVLGASTDTEWFFEAASYVQTQTEGGTTVAGAFPADKLHNLAAPLDVVSDIGTVPGGHVSEFSEATNILDAHSKDSMSDALAVYSLFSDLSTDLSFGQITPLLKLGSNQADGDLEGIVNKLGKLLGFGSTVETGNRDQFYARIQAISTGIYIDPVNANFQLKPAYQNLHIVQVESLANHATADNAQGQAYRYALVNLNPFAITGPASLYSAQADDFKADKFTEQYLNDRAAMLLYGVLPANAADTDYESESALFHYYWDAETAIAINTVAGRQRILFGDMRPDTLVGADKGDHLYGGGSIDTLQGNGGNDYLEGGTGNDTYIYNSGDGLDTIYDSDGLGNIKWDGTPLTGGKTLSENSFYDEANKIHYQFEVDTVKSDGSGTLIISKEGQAGGLHILNYTPGQLGLTLNPARIAPPTTRTRLTGDEKNNYLVITESLEQDNRLQGLEGHDDLIGGGGNDLLEGGAGINRGLPLLFSAEQLKATPWKQAA